MNLFNICFLSMSLYVHLEAVETAKDTTQKTTWAQSAGMAGISDGQYPERLLVDGSHRGRQDCHHKRKTDKLGFYDLAAAYQSMHVNC